MPATRPRAAFEPIPPQFELKQFVEKTPNFAFADRISCDMIDIQGQAQFEKLVLLHVVIGGKPLVIDGFENHLDLWSFTRKWLQDNCGDKVETARVLNSQENLALTMGHYVKNMGKLTDQFFDKPGAYREKDRQRVYLKDIDCPPVWIDKLKEHVPSSLFYLNDSTGDFDGPGALPETISAGVRTGRGIARAGDLMSSLPEDMRAENLMCYIGHEGTYTPAHREMCASLGQNIMVGASSNMSDDGQEEKPGSSIWFMTESKERHVVSEYWLSVLGHDIEVENHFAQIVAWKKAPFSVYVVEQRPGDLILIPPLAPHQVWNRGTCTMKVAWNRTTVETLEMALHEALPRSRIVCRDEQYKNKAIVYYTLQKYASLLMLARQQAAQLSQEEARKFLYTGKIKQLQKDFRRLFGLYKEVLLSEVFGIDDREAPKSIDYIPFDSNVTCAYCRGNIFNRFLTCPSCKDALGHQEGESDGDPYDVCMECYAMGRSCACISNLKWVEQFRWKELASKYESWRKLIIALDGGRTTDKTPLTMAEERRKHSKKTLAEVCKEQLKRRPWKDYRKSPEELADKVDSDEEEIVVNDDGTVKALKKKPSKVWLKNSRSCHVCNNRHASWKMAACTTCERAFCYGSLFRGWDKMPMEIMEDKDWSCPHCLEICFAGACRKDPKMHPYEPKGTLLGHDTRKVADVRSVETLVDFSVSNLTWLRDDNTTSRTESSRFKRARAEANEAIGQEPTLEEDDEDDADQQILIEETSSQSPAVDDMFIDPALTGRPRDVEAVLADRLRQDESIEQGDESYMTDKGQDGLEGYTAVSTAGFNAVHVSGPYDYATLPSRRSPESVHNGDAGPELRPFLKRSIGELGEDGNINMQKHRPKGKKPKLAVAGFRSSDLAEGTASQKGRSEVQRQFEKEKERKAVEKAKAEGRFIILQAKLRGKKRIVKMSMDADRLRELTEQHRASRQTRIAEDAATSLESTAGNASAQVLTSDIVPKKVKDPKEYMQQRERDGFVMTGKSKKALVPVEKDDTYSTKTSHRAIEPRVDAGARRKSRKSQVDYEEIDIGSDVEEFAETRPAKSKRTNRRSAPGYLRARGDEAAEDAARAPVSLDVQDDDVLEALDTAARLDPAMATQNGSRLGSHRAKNGMAAAERDGMDEANQQAKLQALQAMGLIDDAVGGSEQGKSGIAKDAMPSHGNTVSLAQVLSDGDDSDDGPDAIGAR